jgi:hypothetical protein
MRTARKNGKWKWKYDLKGKARSYLNVYVRRGKIVRGPCEVCGRTDLIHGHHEDYTKPLEVRWLCRTHHRMVDDGRIILPPRG